MTTQEKLTRGARRIFAIYYRCENGTAEFNIGDTARIVKKYGLDVDVLINGDLYTLPMDSFMWATLPITRGGPRTPGPGKRNGAPKKPGYEVAIKIRVDGPGELAQILKGIPDTKERTAALLAYIMNR